LRRGRDDSHEMLSALAALVVAGVQPEWKAVEGGATRRKIALPTYPFERERHWIDRPPSADRSADEARAEAVDLHPLLGRGTATASGGTQFERELTIESVEFLRDHVV